MRRRVEVEAALLAVAQIVGTVGPKKENRRNAFVRVQWLTGVVWSSLLLAGWCLFLNEGSCDAEWDDVMPEAATLRRLRKRAAQGGLWGKKTIRVW